MPEAARPPMPPHRLARFAPVAVLAALLLPACAAVPGDTPADERAAVRAERDLALQLAADDEGLDRSEVAAAAGYATLTNVVTQGLLVGGRDGYGLVVDNATGRETFVEVDGVNFGPGVGIATYRMVLVFHDANALRDFLDGEWDFGAQTAAVAPADGDGPDPHAGAEQAAAFSKDYDVYLMGTGGLAAAADFRGLSVEPIDRLND